MAGSFMHNYFVPCTDYHVEQWSVIDCLYFVSVTVATAGFGDLAPKTSVGRVFTIFFIIVGMIFVFTSLMTAVTEGMDGAERRMRTMFGINGTYGLHVSRRLVGISSLDDAILGYRNQIIPFVG
jgi:CBS domain containing-hemolysin-like protein